MSLRLMAGLLVVLSVLLVPATSLVLLQWFPPPPIDWSQGPCRNAEPGRWPCPPRTESPERPGDAGDDPGDAMPGSGKDGDAMRRPPFKPGPRRSTPLLDRLTGGGPRFEGAQTMRDHFLWINLASLALVVIVAIVLASFLLRRPIRALLAAIGDIERGAAPPAWAFPGPREFRTIGLALERLGLQLRENLQERQLMLAGLSHDLRSPLARIQAKLELRAADGERWDDTLRDVAEIDHIVGQFVDFARDGRDEPAQPRNVDDVVRSALQHRAGADLSLDLAAGVSVPLRSAALRRALINLVDNAMRHGCPPVVVRTRAGAAAVSITVEDAGSGIAVADWARLVQPFARGSVAREPAGAGLGLAIVERVARMHHGRLSMRPPTAGRPFAIELQLPREAQPNT